MSYHKLLAFVFVAVLLNACASGPVEIPENLSAAELVQRGQEAADRTRYALSLQYYQAILERFPEDINTAGDICAAEYEIAFIHYKQKLYQEAKTEFTSLLARYDSPDEELLPAKFKILSRKILNTILEIENRRNKAVVETPSESSP
jgi:outer membrane protein assembly factor BamD (BamD/ComL family)